MNQQTYSRKDILDGLRWAIGQIDDCLCPDHQAALDACRATIAAEEIESPTVEQNQNQTKP